MFFLLRWSRLLFKCGAVNEKTRRGYRYQAGCLLRFSGKESIEAITQADVDTFRTADTGYSPVTIEAAIKAAGIIRGEKFGGRKVRRIRTRNKTVPLDDLSRVYAVAKKRGNVFIARWLKWAYITGFRLGDLMSLTREQMAADVIELDASKTERYGKYHAVPKHPILCCRLPDCEFPLKRSPGRLRKKIAYYCNLAGVPYFTPQEIRRTAATQYELARPKAGGIIQGSALKSEDAVTWQYYIDQVAILTEAQQRLAIPEAMLPKSERSRQRIEERQLIEAFKRVSPGDRDAILRMVSRLSW